MTSKKVIYKKQEEKFQWTQTEDSITISFPIKNVLLKNIDILYTDNFLKVNVPSQKYISIIDFPHNIDYENPKNRVQLHDQSLDVMLIKAEQGQIWENIQLQGLSREEIHKRREEGQQRYNQRQEQKFKEAESKKHQFDKYSVDQLMKQEKFQRQQIKEKKQQEKSEAENQLFQELDAMEQKNTILEKQKHQQEKYQHELNANQQILKQREQRDEEKRNFNFKNNKDSDIFGEEDCVVIPEGYTPSQNQSKENSTEKANKHTSPSSDQWNLVDEGQEVETTQVNVPEPRKQQDVKMQFTEKKYPHLPARESQLKEPPYPKSKQIDKKKDTTYIDVEDKDPVWLKDKGDHFYNRNDFQAAINAYTKALEYDKEFLMGRLNRATTWIRVRAFENCINDCNDIENQILGLKESEREDDFYTRLLYRAYLKRGASYAWVSNFDKALEDFDRALQSKMVFTEQELGQMERDREKIEKRKYSFALKSEGDELFIQQKLTEALEKYEQAIEIDKYNEYAWGNIGLIHMKKLDYEKCIEYSSRALEIVNEFQSDTKSFQRENRLEVKLLLRRGKSYEIKGELEKAKADLDSCVMLEPQNGEARTLLKKVQEKIDQNLFQQYRDIANQYLQTKKFPEALEYYENCLKITKKGTTLDNIAVYVNKIACLLSLEKYDKVVLECNDALRLIKNFRNRFEEKQNQEERQRLQQMEIRVSVRRGNALAKLNRVGDAIAEYERALKMDPNNEGIKRDLAVLKKQ